MIKIGDEEDFCIDGNYYSVYNNIMDYIYLKGLLYMIINMFFN